MIEPYAHEALQRSRLTEALAAAELARVMREQPGRVTPRRWAGAALLARLRARRRPARVAAARARVATASAPPSSTGGAFLARGGRS